MTTKAQQEAARLAPLLLAAANAHYSSAVSCVKDSDGNDVVRVGEWVQGWPSTTDTLPHLVDTGQSRWVTDTDVLVYRVGITRRNSEGRGRPPTAARSTAFDDGLWFVDAMFIEGCGAQQNFFDKRSRFAAQTSSKTLELQAVSLKRLADHAGMPECSDQAKGLWNSFPDSAPIWLPVRYLCVLYVLNDTMYTNATRGIVVQSHEYLMSASCAAHTRIYRAFGTTSRLDRMVSGWASVNHFLG